MKYVVLLAVMGFGVAVFMDNFVTKSKYDALQKEFTQYVSEKAELQTKLDTYEKQPKHHYELKTEGFRTFRFDSITGETCRPQPMIGRRLPASAKAATT